MAENMNSEEPRQQALKFLSKKEPALAILTNSL